MVRRVWRVVYKEVRGLHQAAYVLALFAFGSQILALVRDRMLAHQFGAGNELDLYYAAFRVPDVLFVLFASTLSVYVLIPFVAKARESHQDDAAARDLLGQVFTLFLWVYVALAAVLFVAAPYVSALLFPGLADQTTLVLLLRILLLQPLFLGISSIFGVVTQLGHRFVLYALSPLVYNFGIIFGIAVLEPWFGLAGLAWGVVLGAAGHMIIQWPLVRSSSLAFTRTQKFNWSKIRDILWISLPRACTLSLSQVVMLALVAMASVMAAGSVSVFQFAFNLQSVPLAIIGVSYSVAAFPILAEFCSQKKWTEFNIHLTTALRHIIFWSLPVIALVVVLRAQLVRVVLGSGAFDWSDTRLTAAVLALLTLSLVAQAINLIAIRAFYAGGYTRVPFYTAVFGALASIGSAYGLLIYYGASPAFQKTFTTLMRVDEVVGGEVLVLALGYSIGVILQMGILGTYLVKTYHIDVAWLPRHVARSLIAATVGASAAYATLNFIVDGINPDTFLGIFIQGFVAGCVGIVGVILGYAVCRSPELSEVAQAFHRRLFKTDVVAPAEDII